MLVVIIVKLMIISKDFILIFFSFHYTKSGLYQRILPNIPLQRLAEGLRQNSLKQNLLQL